MEIINDLPIGFPINNIISQHLYQRSVADARGDQAESGDQSWFADWRGLG